MWNHFGYRTPIDGLYMAGSPAHPGGAISGGAGYIGARIIARGPRGQAVVGAGRRPGRAEERGDLTPRQWKQPATVTAGRVLEPVVTKEGST